MKTKNEVDKKITMPLYEIRVSLTGACNQNCVYCGPFVDGKYEKGYGDLNLSQIKLLASELKELINKSNLHIQLTGGEPTLRKDLLEIVSIFVNQDIRDIGITTNGSMLNPLFCLDLIKHGISDFHIHLPSLDLDVYKKTVRKNFDNSRVEKIIKSVKIIKSSGVRVEFNTPVTEINFTSLDKLLDFCYENKINLKLIEELSFGGSKISFLKIKNFLIKWFEKRKIEIIESKIENKYGFIYKFDEEFFFRIAPVSEEFKSHLSSSEFKLLDGRYWIGGKNNLFLYTPSYFLDPIEGSLQEVKDNLKNTIEEYNSFFN